MGFRKEEMVKQSWVLEMGGHMLPVGDILKPILLLLLALDLAFQFGIYTQGLVQFTAYMADNGVYDPYLGEYGKCVPQLDKNRYVMWNCTDSRGNQWYGYDSEREKLNLTQT